MTELVILRGLPASGKTTWARKWVEDDREHRARVNRNTYRKMLDDGVYIAGVTESRIIEAEHGSVRALLKRGISVVVDDTNLPRRTVRDLARVAASLCNPGQEISWRVEDQFLDVSVEECLKRDLHRKEYVGATVIKDMNERYIESGAVREEIDPDSLWGGNLPVVEPYRAPAGSTPILLVDVDGTVALRGLRNPFDESTVSQDAPNWPVIQLVNTTATMFGAKKVFLSGRSDGCYEDTLSWLMKYVGGLHALHMRPSKDNRPDYQVKAELFDKHIREHYRVLYVFDDRNQVVEMWRSLGLTVMQVADGNF